MPGVIFVSQHRPCRTSLEQVLRLSTTDACFPFANGEFLHSDWSPERCAEEAGITLP